MLEKECCFLRTLLFQLIVKISLEAKHSHLQKHTEELLNPISNDILISSKDQNIKMSLDIVDLYQVIKNTLDIGISVLRIYTKTEYILREVEISETEKKIEMFKIRDSHHLRL